jgi:hypothetical protein
MKIYYPIGNYGLKCHKCNYESKPQEEKNVALQHDWLYDWPWILFFSGFTAYNRSDGGYVVVRDCDSSNNGIFCPDARKTCKDKTQKEDLKSCAAFCCTTELCNNYTSNPFNFNIPKTSSNPTILPGTATCVLVVKFNLLVMIILGLIFA